jgi:hypothetical protein
MNASVRNSFRSPLWGCAGLLAMVLLAIFGVPFTYFQPYNRALEEKQRDILYRSDHAAVLASARELMRWRAAEHAPHEEVCLPPDDVRLPEPLRRLNSQGIYVEDERVLILFGGGPFLHQLEAFAADRPDHPVPREGSVDLLPGLRYWAEGRRPLPRP